MRAYIKLADTLSTSIGKAFSWCIVILMGGTCYEVMMAYVFNKPTLWNFDFSMQMYGAILMMPFEAVKPFLKVGMHSWDTSRTVGAGSADVFATSVDGTDFLRGIGLSLIHI